MARRWTHAPTALSPRRTSTPSWWVLPGVGGGCWGGRVGGRRAGEAGVQAAHACPSSVACWWAPAVGAKRGAPVEAGSLVAGPHPWGGPPAPWASVCKPSSHPAPCAAPLCLQKHRIGLKAPMTTPIGERQRGQPSTPARRLHCLSAAAISPGCMRSVLPWKVETWRTPRPLPNPCIPRRIALALPHPSPPPPPRITLHPL